MPNLRILDYEHQQILEECRRRREARERRFSPPGNACPYGCDGSGWREVEDEDQTPRFLEVIYDGKLFTPCECNMGGRAVRRPFEEAHRGELEIR